MIWLGAIATALAGEPTLPETEAPRLLSRPTLSYPPLARDLPLPPISCSAEVTVAVDGRTQRVEPIACPPLFDEQARYDLSMWRFLPARTGEVAVPALVTFELDWQPERNDPVQAPDLAQWAWTDDALQRMARQDFVIGAASIGLSVIGIALVVLAAREDVLETYRGRYLAAGGGLILFSIGGLNAAARFEGMGNRRRQRTLWETFRPAPDLSNPDRMHEAP